MSERWTLVPGDRVLFDGHEWTVFVTPKDEQRNDSAISIYRPRYSNRAGEIIDLLRQRCELQMIPRITQPNPRSNQQ